MRRTIETAFYVFKEHPNFIDIKFILAPSARELIGGAGDIAIDIAEVIKTYSPLFPQGLD